MDKVATVYYDGEVFRPEGPVVLEPNARYVISIEAAPSDPGDPLGKVETAWDVLDRLTGTIEGPGDWSAEHDHSLYGTPRRSKDRPG